MIALIGCAVEPPKPPLVQTVAVLPFDSEANNVDAPEIMQTLVTRALNKSAYSVLDPAIVKEKLEKAGIVDGGQLAAVDPVKVGRDLGVQGLLYGYVSAFNFINVGVYVQKKVSIELKLVDVNTGQSIWEHPGTAVYSKIGLNAQAITENFTNALVEQATEKLMKTPLREEAQQATVRALGTLPGFRFCGFNDPAPKPLPPPKNSNEAFNQIIQK